MDAAAKAVAKALTNAKVKTIAKARVDANPEITDAKAKILAKARVDAK